MKILLIAIVLIMVGCNPKEDKKSYSLNPLLYGGGWTRNYVDSGITLEEHLTFSGNSVLIETYNDSTGVKSAPDITLNVSPTGASHAHISNSNTEDDISYSVDATSLGFCYSDGTCYGYTKF